MEQCIRFCTTEDGVRIAYATSGKGSPVVRAGHWLSHLDHDVRSPVFLPLLSRLSEHHLLVRYDPRGTGMSDRDIGEVTPELWLKDLEAVVDALKLERFALLGMSQGGPAAIRYAAKHPQRVSHLILYGSYARGRRHRDEEECTPAMEEAMCALIRSGWGSDNDAYRELFSARYVSSSNREHIQWLNEQEAISATAAMAERYFRALGTIDVSQLLPKLNVPTLVVHCQGDRATPIRYGREIAAGIAGARFVPVKGDNHVFLEGDAAYRRFFEEVEAFLGDRRQLVDRRALRRGARNWKVLVSHVQRAVEPYYVIAAVASLLAGSFSFIWSRFH